MYTALSNVLLAIFAALCIVALGVAAPVLTVAQWWPHFMGGFAL